MIIWRQHWGEDVTSYATVKGGQRNLSREGVEDDARPGRHVTATKPEIVKRRVTERHIKAISVGFIDF